MVSHKMVFFASQFSPMQGSPVQTSKNIQVIMYLRLIFFCILDDKCQFWLDESSKVLTSPFFDGINQQYYHNMNCTWMLKAEQGSYVNLKILGYGLKVKIKEYNAPDPWTALFLGGQKQSAV